MRKVIVRVVVISLLAVLLLVTGSGYWLWTQLCGSLPKLTGELALPGLQEKVTVERDQLGVPTITAANREDCAFATGFLHAQERFFQMDLLRRNSAGELAELVGPALAKRDREVRVHRFREVAKQVIDAAPSDERAIGRAYVDGVNAGLNALRVKPFEYFALGSAPAPWTAEDTVLVMFSMYLDLQEKDPRDEAAHGLIEDLLPGELAAFLDPLGTEWDAPLQGIDFTVPPTPGPEVFDLRKEAPPATKQAGPAKPKTSLLASAESIDRFGGVRPGSNNWAVAGMYTEHRSAIVANDMHLGISVPNIWYRARLVWTDGAGEKRSVTGATLPGTPAVVVGSNGYVAWGFTNSEGDWEDLVILEPVEGDPDSYQTPDGPKKFERHTEVIKVRGEPDQKLEIASTIWGPVYDKDHKGRQRALRWVAHDPNGVNMKLLHIENTEKLEDALEAANRSGSPAQNFTVASKKGRVGWTILGRIPRRVGFNGRVPSSWADGQHRWDGWLEPSEYPRVVEPAGGRIWTANARVVSDSAYEVLGDGGYDLGARATQIRDALAELTKANEEDMLKIQLDDRALFLARWRQLLLDLLTPEVVAKNPRRKEFRELVEKWGGRASTDSVGYRLVRAWRVDVTDLIFEPLTARCKAADPEFKLARLEFSEGPAYRLLTEKPIHLLDPKYQSWDEPMLAVVDAMIEEGTKNGGRLADLSWGAYNTTKIQHPLSKAVPFLSRWLDMKAEAVPGSSADMPRIQSPTSGASQRMAVAPGHEEEGYFHMPCGQSGHPLSENYSDGHEAWVKGLKTPFLPGPTMNKLVLSPMKASG